MKTILIVVLLWVTLISAKKPYLGFRELVEAGSIEGGVHKQNFLHEKDGKFIKLLCNKPVCSC
jgi:hypothetical protein